jgi:hypothetical protein
MPDVTYPPAPRDEYRFGEVVAWHYRGDTHCPRCQSVAANPSGIPDCVPVARDDLPADVRSGGCATCQGEFPA